MAMKCDYSCKSAEHTLARRQFLGGMIGGAGVLAGGVPALATPQSTQQLAADGRRVLVIFLSGGLSQLESWDPKPKTETGGPFRAIPTSVPGIHISELLPKTAMHMDKLALVRSVNTHNGDHGKGRYQMTRGRDQRPGDNEPHLGAVVAKGLEDRQNPLPGHVRIPSARSGDGAYLGPRYGSVGANGKPPANSSLPGSLNEKADLKRNDFRRRANQRFLDRRRAAETDLYTYSFEQAEDLMRRRDVFDLSKEPQKEHERYGQSEFGQHCLLARRLLERGVTYAQISHSNYDTHNENFNFHLEQLGEFDQSFSVLIDDLHQRGMLESTLVVVMSEFGRTPRINARYGRDHWGKAWSVCLGGTGVQAGAVIGKTNETGTEVTEAEVDHGNLFHTYLSAVGLDTAGAFDIGGRQFPIADPAREPIWDLLA
jgi:hypothetical protein